MAKISDKVLKKIREAKEKGLKNLDLSGWGTEDEEKLTEIPSEVFELTQLEILTLRYNLLTTIPETITKLQNLTVLNLRGNQLTTIPETITKLQNLSELNLSGNQITTIPETITDLQNLSELNLRDNQLTTIPETITKLQNLTVLNLSNNPIKAPPPEIVAKGISAIKDYFRQIETEGQEYLYEAKLLIVGEPGAGKTTLSKKIQDPNYKLRKDEGTTRGIDVVKWNFPMGDGRTFQVNIWDFGGQQIYHATHQFFLTKRSLYILVSDNRREDTDFHYWLNIVELLGGESPLLIIQNEMQERYREIDEQYYKGLFNNLKEIFDINLSKKLSESKEWENIMDSIEYHISHLDHIGNPLPKTWTKVREKLESDLRNYIDLIEYLSICEENGIVEKDYKLQLSGYLHDLGVCLHFQEDPILREKVILKPEWATEAVYKILDDEKINRDFGRFGKPDIEGICNESIYDNMHSHILQLMLNFKLCYEIPNKKGYYIAPQLLSVNKPKYEWDENENIIIRYTYKFMPKGIISRFIVAMHEDIYKENQKDCVWKRGVVLGKDQTMAEVIENYEEREIKIRVVGKHKKELITIVTYELDKIHYSFSHLKYEKLVPCNCSECKNSQNPFFYSFDTLMKFVGDRKYEIQCQNSYEMVNVLSLIDDVIIRKELYKEALREETTMPKVDKVTSSWANGSFFLFTFLTVVTAFIVVAKTVDWYALPIIVFAAIVIPVVVGALQLMQDKRLSEKGFITLMGMTFKQLPLIRGLSKSQKSDS
jgi:GTPase SAR1 family protein